MQSESKPRLINSKHGAVITLCFIGYVAALSFRNVLSHSQRQHHWLLDLDGLVYWHTALPAWAVAVVNLVFYAGLFWGAVMLYRNSQANERVLVVGGFVFILLGLIQILVSASAASAIDYVKAIVAIAELLAAADILLKMPARATN